MEARGVCARRGVIVGAWRGIGRALFEGCLERCWQVVGPTLSVQEIQAVDSEKSGVEGRGWWVPCDVRDPSQVDGAWEAVCRLVGVPDFLIYNAGIGYFAPIEELTLAQWDEMFQVNVRGAYLWARRVFSFFKERGIAGDIVFIGSIAGKVGFEGGTGYCATKFALRGLAKSLMEEGRKHWIRVSYIAPGTVATEFFRNFPGIEPADWMLRPEDVARVVLDVLTMRDGALVDEVVVRPVLRSGG